MKIENAIVIGANHGPRTLVGLIGPFLRGPISRRTQSMMERIKLSVETRLAESGR
jgi:hypothetical protein